MKQFRSNRPNLSYPLSTHRFLSALNTPAGRSAATSLTSMVVAKLAIDNLKPNFSINRASVSLMEHKEYICIPVSVIPESIMTSYNLAPSFTTTTSTMRRNLQGHHASHHPAAELLRHATHPDTMVHFVRSDMALHAAGHHFLTVFAKASSSSTGKRALL